MGKFIKSSYKNIFLLIFLSILLNNQISNQCSICLSNLNNSYLIDVWGNKFHSYHEENGYYCDSCSRLISEGITHGGYKTTDNRYICSLCYPNLVYEKQIIEISRLNVLNQLNNVGFYQLPNNTPIILLDKSELLQISENIYHKNLKGFTKIESNIYSDNNYTIYILKNLHQIEFEAVLAHEYLHIWQDIFNIKLTDSDSEGLCNLASGLLYDNHNNQFSKILKTTLYNDNTIYGSGYKKMDAMKTDIGWIRLIEKIKSNYFY